MKRNLAKLILITLTIYSCGNLKNSPKVSGNDYKDIRMKDMDTSDYLIRIPQNEYELGEPFGFINSNNDTIIPVGKYYGTLTDTLKTFAVIFDANNEIIGVNKQGQVLFEIFKYDNGPDYLAEGYFRVLRNGKIGYANKNGEVKIKCQFDCDYPFENGKAKVSKDCIEVEEFEYSRWESENWYFIDKEGKVVE